MSTIDLSPGSLFAGQFRIVRPLAKGGMGAVYVVEQVSTGRERALKLMHPTLVSDAKSIERFEREAQVGSRIESDHVVEVIAAGVEAAGPTPWICMELLKGETLADRVDKRGPVSLEEATEIVRQLGHALVAAHRAGIVHRDLKPENLFLSESRRDGVPFTLKVLDFGVATLTDELQGPKTTQGVGSPLWMAPEQTNVGKVVPATDVWALGLIAFYLLTGQSYWRTVRTPGSTITALLVEIMMESLEPPSVRAKEVAPGVILPQGFDAWFARCVVRDPAARFPDATSAIPALLSVLSSRATLPEGLGPTVAAVSIPTLPQSSSRPPEPVALAATQPGTALAASGPAGPWQSGPHGAPVRLPPDGAATASAPPVTSVPAAAPRRRVWPWVLLGTLGLGGACAIGLTYQAVTGVRQVAEDVRQSGLLEGEVRDPETGAHVVLGPDGLEVTAPGVTIASVGPQGVRVEAEGTDVVIARPAPTVTEPEPEPVSEPDPEPDTVPDTVLEPSAEPLRSREGRRVPRARAEGRAQGTVTPEQAAHFRDQVVRRCRTNLEGQTSTRFVVRIDGARIGVEPTDTRERDWFARCVRLIAHEQGAAEGTYVFNAP
ncbi:MAG: hypothetical protein OHK0013_09970 [Sandaracinaceae bacterium]